VYLPVTEGRKGQQALIDSSDSIRYGQAELVSELVIEHGEADRYFRQVQEDEDYPPTDVTHKNVMTYLVKTVLALDEYDPSGANH
jgi:hypothetical protein